MTSEETPVAIPDLTYTYIAKLTGLDGALNAYIQFVASRKSEDLSCSIRIIRRQDCSYKSDTTDFLGYRKHNFLSDFVIEEILSAYVDLGQQDLDKIMEMSIEVGNGVSPRQMCLYYPMSFSETLFDVGAHTDDGIRLVTALQILLRKPCPQKKEELLSIYEDVYGAGPSCWTVMGILRQYNKRMRMRTNPERIIRDRLDSSDERLSPQTFNLIFPNIERSHKVVDS
jgi:hypothetical protein